jgi:hypothetical protein
MNFPNDGIQSSCNGQDNPCFVATACFGTEMGSKIDVLRSFRDMYLLKTRIGNAFVTAYYNYSPPIADSIAGNGWLKAVVRMLLLPVVGLLSLFV